MNGAAWGGSEEVWYRTALWMSANNYRVSVCYFDWKEKNERTKKLKSAGCDIYLLPNKKGFFKKIAIKKSLNKINFKNYNLVVVNQGGWEDVLHAPFKNLYKKLPGYVIINHNYNEKAELSYTKKELLQRWVYGAQMNFGDAGKIFEVLERKFSFTIEKKSTLTNPITFIPENVAPAFPPLENGTCTWVMLAELDIDRKAQDILVKVLTASKWKDRNWQLHLYGKGKDKELLEKLVSESGLKNKVFLKGYTANVKQTLLQSHLLLQCTRIDAMPISVVEAMAMARPCLVSNVGDMPLWISDTLNGFICNEISVAALDMALEKCWQQKHNWAEMGKKAFETFTKKYPQPYEEKTADILNRYFK